MDFYFQQAEIRETVIGYYHSIKEMSISDIRYIIDVWIPEVSQSHNSNLLRQFDVKLSVQNGNVLCFLLLWLVGFIK